ncbi:MAG TPA: polysaccharide deacetylase family protein, partial [Chitinivibrionales bacterium]
MPFKKQIALTGLDLDSLLASRSVPDWVSVEVMWQQWADEYKNSRRFTPAWTARAISQALRRITGRALLIAHVELSSFGNAKVTKDGFLQSIVAARKSGAYALEFYDSHLADSIGIWRELKAAVDTRPDRRVLLLYDTVSYAESKAVAALCGHFDIDVVLLSVNKFRGFLVRPTDFIIYIGCDQETSVPEEFLRFAEKPPVPLFWLQANLNQLLSRSAMLSDSFGFTLKTSAENNIVRSIEYKGKKFFYTDSSCIALSIVDSGRVVQHAIAQTAAGEKRPYIVQSGNFWYLADYTLGFDIGDRHVIFADVLHDFLSEDHVQRHCALVRIEDVTTRTDPRQIRELADYFYKNGIPWSIALVPFYVDPDRNINESLSDAPVLTAALRFAISHGAAIVEHGVTHQYRGHSTDDFEFWDLQNERPLLEDSREFVAARLQKGLSEMHACGLYPVVFETPHYGASPLDYSVFDEFFSTEYGRRDQPDACGTVAPFYISHHPTGCRLIPENCGYVSVIGADVKSILAAGENLLAVRDGMASFFFHPWIDIGALKLIVDKFRTEGYEFIDIRDAACCVRSSLFSQYTGSGEARLNLNGSFLHTFCIDESGEKVNERYSSQGLFVDTAFHDVCPSGRIFVAEGVVDRPSPLSLVKLPNLGIRKLFKAWTAPKPPLTLRSGAAARVEILWTGDSATSADRYYATQYAWKKSFESCGIPVSLVETHDFTDLPPQCNLAVVPSAAARRLTAQQTSELMRLVMAGTDIVLECPSPLGDSLGFHAQSPVVEIDSVADVNYPQTIFAWKPAEMV